MSSQGYLVTGKKEECLGCSACVQVCPHSALSMKEDSEGFGYPALSPEACVDCGLCHKVCPQEKDVEKHSEIQTAFGGYALDEKIRCQSTSGGAFSCIVDAWCDENCVIFGAVAKGLDVHHEYVLDKAMADRFRKSKYSQSKIGNTYREAYQFLKDGRKVLFSGTPCQIAGLRKFLEIRKTDINRLLTVEVVCEGVPSPYYVRKLDDYLTEKYGAGIKDLDYRYKDGRYDVPSNGRRKGRWDFEVMHIRLKNSKTLKKDRWFNPFWSIWLNHLMNRPSCYSCPYATKQRVTDITLGDLWGVHIYCPELYGDNGGSSLIVANTKIGQEVARKAETLMYGHSLDMDDVVRFQGPMRKSIPENPLRVEFMSELVDPETTYTQLMRKWALRPSFKLLFSKYIWGNHQKVRLWKIKRYLSKR